MKTAFLSVIAALGLSACSYNPLDDQALRQPIGQTPPSGPAVKVTYFGNTTLLIQDGTTSLLVDGFFSRPGMMRTVFSKIGPPKNAGAELRRIGINRLDAVLVGHSHHDHALDATAVADEYETTVIGSESFAHIYRGSHQGDRNSTLVTVPAEGGSFRIPESSAFKATFVPSAHIRSFNFVQRMLEGSIPAPLQMPARFTDFKCGDVFALYISHPQGNIVVTTTANAAPGQLRPSEHNADVAFLSTGFLAKETPQGRTAYWKETVEATNAKVVVPVHWDNFARPLSRGLKSPPFFIDRPRPAMEFIKNEAKNETKQRPVRVLNVGESLWISGNQVYCPKPGA